MHKNILITGANGMLARHLSEQLEKSHSIRFLTRRVTAKNEYLWDVKNKYIDPEALKNVHIVIHLAGASIADKRWTKKRKDLISSSRVAGSLLILNALKAQGIILDKFISASATGFYGTVNTDEVFNEESEKGTDFLSAVCVEWENAAHMFFKSRVAQSITIIRIGIILAKNEGALKKISQPIKLGIGAGIGSGKQYMPWIHIKDLSKVFEYTIKNNLNGVYNAVAPQHINNIDLTNRIGSVLNRKIFLPNIPKFVMKVLFGKMSSILIYGSRVSSKKLTDLGFTFEFNTVKEALDNLFIKK